MLKKILILFYCLLVQSSMFAMEDCKVSITEDYVDVPGGKIWYQTYSTENSKDKTPIILLHGGPGFPHNYLLNLAKLSEERPVIFYDQLGCGKSPIENNDSSLWVLPRFVEELDCLINALSIKECHLFGHSWGGALSIEYSLAHPEKVKSLILASPLLSSSLWAQDTKHLLSTLSNSVRIAIACHEAAGTTKSREYQFGIMQFNKKFVCRLENTPQLLIDSASNVNGQIYSLMWGLSEFNVTGNLKDFNRLEDLDQLHMPVLITCGDFDEATPKSMHMAKEKIPNAKLVIFENSSHVAHLEEPEKYLKELKSFLNKNS